MRSLMVKLRQKIRETTFKPIIDATHKILSIINLILNILSKR